AVSDPNTSRRWNVRAMPRRARWCALSSVTSRSSRYTWPAVGVCSPVMTLNVVVLPAPLGPMSPVTYPTSASRSTPWTAWMPPKRTSTSLTRSTGKAHLLSLGLAHAQPSRQQGPYAVAELTQLSGHTVGVAAQAHGGQAG